MKNVMDLLLLWQFELVGFVVYWMQYLKRPEKLSFKLAILFDHDVLVVQPNFVIKTIAPRLYNLVIDSFLKF